MINNFIHLLKTSGIKDVCISPGLRNTIISLGFIKNGFNCHSILDERSSAYFALGMALKTKRPSVLICTSGTATANYLPAIIEASQSKVPIIIITADRPRQLLNTGENQTINQKSIYGDFVRSSLSFDNREDVIDKINDSLKFININNSKITIGPIHFNIHLDDFEKENENIMNKQIPNTISNVINTYNFNWDSIPFEDTFNIHNYQKPLIILGRLSQKLDSKLIFKLSKHLKAPILTDPLSQLRFSDVDSLNLYEHYIDQSHIQPDLIIRIGQKPVSKKLNKKITKLENDGIEHLNFSSLLIDESGQFNDNASTILKVHYKEFIHFILNNTKENHNNTFYNDMYQLEQTVSNIIDADSSWSELGIAKTCLLSIRNKENLVIGNSMPIRYIDMLGSLNINRHINMYSNRGASGIDGVIATSLGIASKSKHQTTLLIGDLSFIYDQSSLMLAKQLKINLTIVIINNNGGGIFSLLPVANSFDKATFTKYWTTPQKINIEDIAALYSSNYSITKTIQGLKKAIKISHKNLGINIIEAQIDIKHNKKQIEDLKNKIKKGIV